MYKIKNKFIILLTLVATVVISCQDQDELNINPNGVDPATADLNLLLPTIQTELGKSIVSLGFGDIAGVMQHTQKDGWSSGHNDYDWDINSNSWSGYYGILRNNDEFYNKAVEEELDFHQGVGLIFKSLTFGMITDLWGDAPYSEALQADKGIPKPAYDSQQAIYAGVLSDLELANTILSSGSTEKVNGAQDVVYGGDPMKWRKLANSLALRYYMRLQAKSPGVAAAGIQKITSNPSKYPLILDASDDATIDYAGNSPSDSWPTNTVFDPSPTGSYMRVKMCQTLVGRLQELNDPRLSVWANTIETPLELVGGSGVDVIVNGVRAISQDIVDDYTDSWGVDVDYDTEYVGIPASVFSAGQYNLNPNLEQAAFNPHASQLNDIYKQTNGGVLLMRIMSAAEVNFILAEAASYGWANGTPDSFYAAGIQQSFNAWDAGDASSYIAGAPYAGLESIMEQKWISSWSAAAEAWFDYRRTGLPAFEAGESAKRQALPLRFYYHFNDEISLNEENADAAIQKLQPTEYKGSDVSNNSAWSKMWVLQGTGFPY